MKRQGLERSGFTLVELLVVIAILGILMAMMVPAAGLIMNQMKKAQARSDAGIVVSVMMKYWMEYGRWPDLSEDATTKRWVDLMAPPPGAARTKDNFHLITFFEAGGGALAKEGSYAGAFVDPWGKPFRYALDRSGGGDVANPNSDKGGRLTGRAHCWSAGPDGDFDTWKDNVASWE